LGYLFKMRQTLLSVTFFVRHCGYLIFSMP
jgi:hypothetical protein